MVIAEASDAEDARRGLVTAFALDEVQATAVLDMQFRRISGLDRWRITDELTQLRSDPALTVGDSVVSGRTKIGTVVDLSRVEHQALARYTNDAGNHVTVEVRPSAAVVLN